MKADPDNQPIPNINIGQVYDQRYRDRDVHYERLEKMADFFGRNMPAHHHDRFYQIHAVLEGKVRVRLDDTGYLVTAPMFFFTPPSVAHAFATDQGAAGHVITVRQETVWNLRNEARTDYLSASPINAALCVKLETETNASAQRLLNLLEMMADEAEGGYAGTDDSMHALLRLILITIQRLSVHGSLVQNLGKRDVQCFQRFNELIERHFRHHLSLVDYAAEMGISPARLNEVCRRITGQSSKRVVIDRLMQEARRQLSFTSLSVSEISYYLGFKDPAYFARYFRRNTGITASEYRKRERIAHGFGG